MSSDTTGSRSASTSIFESVSSSTGFTRDLERDCDARNQKFMQRCCRAQPGRALIRAPGGLNARFSASEQSHTSASRRELHIEGETCAGVGLARKLRLDACG